MFDFYLATGTRFRVTGELWLRSAKPGYRMASDNPHSDDAPPTEEIYLELRELESVATAAEESSPNAEPTPVLADDDPTGIKARIARLRAVLADRGVDPPS